MSLELWNATKNLPPDMTRMGEIEEPLWAPVFEMDGGDGERCKVWILRADAHVDSPTKRSDEEKRYALEAEFDGHMEQKLIEGGEESNALFKEMEAYLKEGYDNVHGVFYSGH